MYTITHEVWKRSGNVITRYRATKYKREYQDINKARKAAEKKCRAQMNKLNPNNQIIVENDSTFFSFIHGNTEYLYIVVYHQ